MLISDTDETESQMCIVICTFITYQEIGRAHCFDKQFYTLIA